MTDTDRDTLERMALIIAAQYHDAECPDDRCEPTVYAHLLPPARKAAAALLPVLAARDRQQRQQGRDEAAEVIARNGYLRTLDGGMPGRVAARLARGGTTDEEQTQ